MILYDYHGAYVNHDHFEYLTLVSGNLSSVSHSHTAEKLFALKLGQTHQNDSLQSPLTFTKYYNNRIWIPPTIAKIYKMHHFSKM